MPISYMWISGLPLQRPPLPQIPCPWRDLDYRTVVSYFYEIRSKEEIMDERIIEETHLPEDLMLVPQVKEKILGQSGSFMSR